MFRRLIKQQITEEFFYTSSRKSRDNRFPMLQTKLAENMHLQACHSVITS
jgi:hypothetical protein